MRQATFDNMLGAYFQSINRTRDAQNRYQDLMLAIAAGEPLTMFGRPVEITLSFPDGIPLGKATIEEFQAEMRDWLARHREQSERLAERLT